MQDKFPTLEVTLEKLKEYLQVCKDEGIQYRLGAKPSTLKTFPPKFEFDGKSVREVDCSGFVRGALFHATDGHFQNMPDGSVQQHEWCQHMNFETTDYHQSARLADGRLRIAFIEPNHITLGMSG